MTIHSSHPFADPDVVAGRQLRGRLGSRTSLWCAGTLGSHLTAAGLTVSSFLVVPGDPWRVVGFVHPDSDFADMIEQTGRATVTLLQWQHRELADRFGGLLPSPGGPFTHGRFHQTGHGPLLDDADTWAAVDLESTHEVGWMLQLTCRAAHISVGDDPEPLHHLRGAYTSLGAGSR